MTYTPELVLAEKYERPSYQVWTGSLYLPIAGGGYAKNSLPLGISFSKTGSYSWSFWIKFNLNDLVYKQIIKLGTVGSNGYRIVRDVTDGRNLICLQEMSTYSAERWYYPVGFDVTQWHNIVITWVGNSNSSVTAYCYINGIQIISKYSSITWSNAVQASGPLYFGDEWSDHTIDGHINEIAFYNKLIYPNDVFDSMYRRIFTNPIARWNCEVNLGKKIVEDEVGLDGSNDMSLFSNYSFDLENQSWGSPPEETDYDVVGGSQSGKKTKVFNRNSIINNTMSQQDRVEKIDVGNSRFVSVKLTGNFNGSVVFEGTRDGNTWFYVGAFNPLINEPRIFASKSGEWVIPVRGLKSVRATCYVLRSGSVNIIIKRIVGKENNKFIKNLPSLAFLLND